MMRSRETKYGGETTGTYQRVVVALNSRWRVAMCPDGTQWLLQQRVSAVSNPNAKWKNRMYFRWKDTLLYYCDRLPGKITVEARRRLAALPRGAESRE